jgi:hypothetical protein
MFFLPEYAFGNYTPNINDWFFASGRFLGIARASKRNGGVW